MATLRGRLVNLVMFQVVWFAVVCSAAAAAAWVGLAAAAGWLVLHVALAPERPRELAMIAAVTASGLAVDQLSVALGIQVFGATAWTVGLVPLWIAGLWAAFATTLRSSLGWLRGRPRLAALMGAALGPIVYLGAERLGALRIGDLPRWLAFTGLGLEWAAMMPLALWFAGPPTPQLRPS